MLATSSSTRALGTVTLTLASLTASPVLAAPQPASSTIFQLPPQIATIAGGIPPAFEIEVPIAGTLRTIELSPTSFRSPEFRVLVSGPRGELRETVAPAPRTLRGSIVGLPNARVGGALGADGLSLIVVGVDADGDGIDRDVLAIEPTGRFGEQRVAIPSRDELPEGFCATPDHEHLPEWAGAEAADAGAGGGGQAEGGVAGTNCARAIQIAFDADFEFFQSNGSSVANTVADIENVFAGVETIYANELDTPFLIGTILVRSSSDDPYTTSNPSDLLEQFAAEWATNQAAIPRDIAHLFTGKNLSGSPIGIAFTPGACLGAGYGLSQSKWSLIYNNRVTVTAHEIGHNFNGVHCNGEPDCGIMCASVGGCPGGILNFGVSETNAILGFIDSADCVGPIQPTGVTVSAGTVCAGIETTFVPAPDAVSHTIWRAPSSGGVDDAVAIAIDADSPYLDSSVPVNVGFRYWVSALYLDGCESQLTGGGTGFIAPLLAAPGFVIAADLQTCSGLVVAWSAVPGANGFELWRGTTANSAEATFLADDNSSPFTDNSALPGVTYRYWVRSKNGCGAAGPFGANDAGTLKSVAAAAVPTASDGSSCSEVVVTWPAVAGATGYTLWRGPSADPAQATLLVANATSPASDATIVPGTTYWYFVQSTNSCGGGPLGAGDSGVAGLAGDLNGDCLVNGADLGVLLSQWGTDGSADLNGDGTVDGADLGLLIAAWSA
jgi:hypothetical protein